jgi:hypothetical protein
VRIFLYGPSVAIVIVLKVHGSDDENQTLAAVYGLKGATMRRAYSHRATRRLPQDALDLGTKISTISHKGAKTLGEPALSFNSRRPQ